MKKSTLSGNIGSADFNYFEIKMIGCNEEVCLPDMDIKNTSINFVTIKATPNLIKGEENVITYIQDYSYFKFLDPKKILSTNFFYMKSFITLSDNVLDIFETNEKNVDLFEVSKVIDYYQV